MFTCTKKYIDLPFAHRQHRHAGHCCLIHGHNWSFKFVFGCNKCDENGFVIDFGSLHWLKKWLEQRFDHTLVLNEDDPSLGRLTAMLAEGWPNAEDKETAIYAKIHVVPNCGAEGLAQYIWEQITPRLHELTEGRVFLRSVTVSEDSKNSATYRNE